MQIAATCMNLLGPNKKANFLVTGVWSRAIAAEAAKLC